MATPLSSRPRTPRLRSLLFALLAGALASACRRPPPGVPQTRLDDPNQNDIALVVFLIGDAGEAQPGRSAIVARLQQEVETWSMGLARDSAVSVLFLGDNVYPVGVRDPSDPAYPEDTLRLSSQIDVLAGPNAQRYHTTAYFVAGNHDWGNLIREAGGLRRLTNQQDLLDAARARGVPVRLMPTAGQPGPEVLDFGQTLRVLFLDTHWWLQEPAAPTKRRVLTGIEEAMRTAGGRHVMIAAHHPFTSGGAHGGPMSIWEGLGILWLLRQTGSLVQDLNATVYRDLLVGMQDIFGRLGPPLLFVGGHDHSLQVLEQVDSNEPEWTLVSGAGSKTTEVTFVGGMEYGDDVGGFMRLTFLRDGSVLLHVLATPAEYVNCAAATASETCLQDGVAAFQTVLALRLN
jgi:hypothetical protein